MDAIAFAWNQIDQSGLPAPVYRTAMRLLRLAACNPDGYVRLTKEEVMALCDTDADGTMRRHLIDLSEAGIIHYSTNKVVYISFHAWLIVEELAAGMDIRKSRAPGDHGEAIFDLPRALDDARVGSCGIPGKDEDDAGETNIRKSRAQNDHGEGTFARPSHTCVRAPDRLVGWLSTSSPFVENIDQPTNQPRARDAPKPEPAEVTRSYELLIDPRVGVSRHKARYLAQNYAREEIKLQVMEWLRDLEVKAVRHAGALVNRIVQGYGATLRPSDRASPIYRDHFPEDALPPPRAASWHEIADEYNSYTLEATA